MVVQKIGLQVKHDWLLLNSVERNYKSNLKWRLRETIDIEWLISNPRYTFCASFKIKVVVENVIVTWQKGRKIN